MVNARSKHDAGESSAPGQGAGWEEVPREVKSRRGTPRPDSYRHDRVLHTLLPPRTKALLLQIAYDEGITVAELARQVFRDFTGEVVLRPEFEPDRPNRADLRPRQPKAKSA